jgi:hypothetical protein
MNKLLSVMIFFVLLHQCDIYSQNTHMVTLQSNQPPQLYADAGHDTAFTTQGTHLLGAQPPAYGGTPPYSFQWMPPTDLNSDTIANPTFTHTGMYPFAKFFLTVTDQQNCSAIDSVKITLFYYAVEEIEPPSMKVMPVPARQYLTIEVAVAGGEISLYNFDGKLIISRPVDKTHLALDVGHLQRGVYLLSYTSQKAMQTIKIVLE